MKRLYYNIIKFEPGIYELNPDGKTTARVNRYRIDVRGMVDMVILVMPFDPVRGDNQRQLPREELEPVLINWLEDVKGLIFRK